MMRSVEWHNNRQRHLIVGYYHVVSDANRWLVGLNEVLGQSNSLWIETLHGEACRKLGVPWRMACFIRIACQA